MDGWSRLFPQQSFVKRTTSTKKDQIKDGISSHVTHILRDPKHGVRVEADGLMLVRQFESRNIASDTCIRRSGVKSADVLGVRPVSPELPVRTHGSMLLRGAIKGQNILAAQTSTSSFNSLCSQRLPQPLMRVQTGNRAQSLGGGDERSSDYPFLHRLHTGRR